MVAPVCFGMIGCFRLGLAPGLTWLDAGELMAASHELGIAHPQVFLCFLSFTKGYRF